jgi:hypothetical protein
LQLGGAIAGAIVLHGNQMLCIITESFNV